MRREFSNLEGEEKRRVEDLARVCSEMADALISIAIFDAV